STNTGTGVLTFAGRTHTVTQTGPGCSFTINPASAGFGSAGGTTNVTITAAATNCTWTAQSNDGFISIISATNGVGNGSISYLVAIGRAPERARERSAGE